MNFILILLILGGCSFKPPQDKHDSKKIEAYTENPDKVDSDGDGITDQVELKEGTDPYIADIPSFEGEFFQEVKFVTRFIRRQDNKEESVSFHVKKDGVSENGTQVETRDFLRNGSRFAVEYGALLAKKNGFSGDHLVGQFQTAHLDMFSAPRLNDSKIFPYSEKVKRLEDTYSYEDIEVYISNDLRLSSNRFKTFSEAWIDFYYFDSLEQKFITIGSQLLEGTYYFNRNYKVPLTFRNNNPELVKAISDSGGRHLFIKIRDFKIDQTETFFTGMLENVKKKSVPVVFSNQEGNELKYVGLNGKPTTLKTILERGIKESVIVKSGKLLGVGKYTNYRTMEVSPYGESSVVENKWFITTNEIGQNPFAYSFSPNDPIIISYHSQGEPYDLVPSYFSDYASTENPETLKIFKVLAKNLLNLALTIKPISSITASSRAEISPNCNASPNSSICFNYVPVMLSLTGLEATPVFSTLEFVINGKPLNLKTMIQTKVASFRVKNKESFEIKFNKKIFELIDNSNGVTISLNSVKPLSYSCNGIKFCEDNGNVCKSIFSTPPMCEEGSVEGNGYKLIDKTQKQSKPDLGTLFFSVEYI